MYVVLVASELKPLEAGRELRAAHQPIAPLVEGVVEVVAPQLAPLHLLADAPGDRRPHQQRVLVLSAQHGLQVAAPRRELGLRAAACEADLGEPAAAVVATVRAQHAQEQPDLVRRK